ncbi:hypothetical protein ZWY2020_040486 [Hordeum vulgare]|nr:hypothetical protein ZWY2020_040486 [Hordeum vulgare]
MPGQPLAKHPSFLFYYSHLGLPPPPPLPVLVPSSSLTMKYTPSSVISVDLLDLVLGSTRGGSSGGGLVHEGTAGNASGDGEREVAGLVLVNLGLHEFS